MPILLTDSDIQGLLSERKALSTDFHKMFRLKPKLGHKELEVNITSESGSEFCLIFRQAQFNILDFSAILAFRSPDTNKLFHLRRYNGKSHEHKNPLESQKFYSFHIYQATERYQEYGYDEDAFAEPTDRYSDLFGALRCLIDDCGFVSPPDSTSNLF